MLNVLPQSHRENRLRSPSAEIVDRLNRGINAAIADPRMKTRFADLGGTAPALTPAAYGMLLADETEKWGRVIRAANIKSE
jgi:tripartite-type tricarboxylate transporter receptor subunit TctC